MIEAISVLSSPYIPLHIVGEILKIISHPGQPNNRMLHGVQHVLPLLVRLAI